MRRILVVDDNPDILDALDLLLSLHDYQVKTVSTVREAILEVSRNNTDLIIQDMNFTEGTYSGAEGKTLFYQIKSINPDLPIILMTAWSQLTTAIELVKAGATDYLPKPWDDHKLLELINQSLNEAGSVDGQSLSHRQQKNNTNTTSASHRQIIFASEAMAHLLHLAKKVAPSDISTLITGPNGSGKEKLADFIHDHSHRAHQPCIKINMGAIPQELMEAELFGTEKGAFTGANSERMGRFEAADGGTLFLDEIGNLSLQGQMKLLRVLQTGEFERLGSSKTIQVDVRVISATNSHLKEEIARGTFREDLYYRLNVVELALHPLQKRKDDILPLAKHFIGTQYQFTAEAKEALLAYHWPGNVRELENACKRALIFASHKEICTEDLFSQGVSHSISSIAPDSKAPASIPGNHPASEASYEKQNLRKILEKHHWTISHAASELGLSRQALYRRIEKYQLTPEND